MKKNNKSKLILASTTALGLTLGLGTSFLNPVHAGALTAMSWTETTPSQITETTVGTDTASSAGTGVTITGQTEVAFDIGTTFTNGTISISTQAFTATGLTEADITHGGASVCSGTLDATTVTISNNPLTITLTDQSCGTAGTAVFNIAGNELTTNATPGNYAVNLSTPSDNGGFFIYLGDDNDVDVTAVVEEALAFRITQTGAYNTDVVGAPNLCDLGVLTTTAVSECDYRLNISTNAQNGYKVYITSDGDLRSGTDTIDQVPDSTVITAGNEMYGIQVTPGTITGTGAIAGTDNTPAGPDYGNNDSPIETTVEELLNSTGSNSPTSNAETALIRHRAAINAGTVAGTYNQQVTYFVNASY